MIKKIKRTFKTQSGFSVIELATVMIISGLMLAGILRMMANDQQIEQYKSKQTFDSILYGLAEHVRVFGRYPCPADPTLAAGNANYGVENCTAADPMIGAVPVEQINQALGCFKTIAEANANPGNIGLFRTNTTALSPDTQGAGLALQQNLMSTKQLRLNRDTFQNFQNQSAENRHCLSEDDMADPYGSKLTYAVTNAATRVSSFNPNFGNIDIRTARLPDANSFDATANDVHFVIISHGPDQKGARMESGVPSGTGCGAVTQDDENCDNDAVFVDRLYAAMSNVNDPNHYDDHIAFSLAGYEREDEVWQWTDTDANADGVDDGTWHMLVDTNTYAGIRLGAQNSGPLAPDERLRIDGGDVMVGDPAALGTGNVSLDKTMKATASCYIPPYFPPLVPCGPCDPNFGTGFCP